MNLSAAWKKVLLFGVFGAVGCAAGWLAGEAFLFAKESALPNVGRSATLISKPVVPSSESTLPEEIRDRLKRAGGQSGDVQLTLIWHNVNDLDLHCIGPDGVEISYQKPRSPSGGWLDVDANAGGRNGGRFAEPTTKPVENIFWPKGGAPLGVYRVGINHFLHRPEAGAPNETPYQVNVLHDGKRHEFDGTISNNGTNNNFREIYKFELKPNIAIYTPEKFALNTGSAVKVPVVVQRNSYRGDVEVKVENLPDGVTASTLKLTGNKDEGEIEFRATDSATAATKALTFTATGNRVEASATAELKVNVVSAAHAIIDTVSIGLWTAVIAVGLCVALLAGQNYYLGKSLASLFRPSLVLVILGAAGAGFVSGSIGQGLYSLLNSLSLGIVGHLFGWMLLGLLLGWGVSFFVPNLDPKKAALAGLAGGLLGGVAFAVLSYASEIVGRFGGALFLGFCIGLMVAVVEAAFRRAWLEVRFSEREMITVNLGPEPVKVGGDAKACTVWARGAAPIALRYWIRNNKVYCEDVPTKSEETARDGDSRQAGNVTVVVRTTNADSGREVPRARPSVPAPSPMPLPEPALPVPVAPAPAPAKTTNQDWDDGLPMPLTPSAPARPQVSSILDLEAAPVAKPAPLVAKPPVPSAPKPPVPTAAKPPTPAAPKPPAPAAPKPPAPAATKPTGDPDACPSCGRKAPGKPGARYCMVCDRSF